MTFEGTVRPVTQQKTGGAAKAPPVLLFIRHTAADPAGRSGSVELDSAHHGLEVLERTHANLDAGRLGGPILQFAGEGILDALLCRTGRNLTTLDLHEAGDRKHPDALSLERLLNFIREGLHHRDHVLLLQTGRLRDAPHDLGLRHGLASRLLRHRQYLQISKIVCGSSPPRTGARHRVPKATPIRDSGIENATQKYRFEPEKSVFCPPADTKKPVFALIFSAIVVFPANFAGCDTMLGRRCQPQHFGLEAASLMASTAGGSV